MHYIFDLQLKQTTMTNLLTPSIELRATELMLKGMDPLEAVMKALIDEIDFMGEILKPSSERGKLAKDYLFKKVCKKLGKK